METTKTWDEFIARQVEAVLKGEVVVVRARSELFQGEALSDFWKLNAVTACWIFRSRTSEYWHVDETQKRVVKVLK